MRKKRVEKEKVGEDKLPLEATQSFCGSLVSNLPRKEYALHYRVVIFPYFIKKRGGLSVKLHSIN